MPREKVYKTSRALEKAVIAYFDSVSVMEPVKYSVVSGRTSKGKLKYSLVPKLDAAGNPIIARRYVSPPGMAALCIYLGISPTTLGRYAAEDKSCAAVIEYAKLVIEAYLAGELMTRDKVDGVKFNMSHNYGWGEKQKLEIASGPVTVQLEGELNEWAG